MPYPPFEYLERTITIIEFIPTVIIFAFLMICPIITKRIVEEKVNRAKELMKMMGMGTVTYWAGTFISNFTIMFIICIVKMIIYSIPYDKGATILAENSPSLFFIVLLLYCASTLLLCFISTILFNKAAVVVTVVVVLWLTTLIAGYFVVANITMSYTVKLLVCLVPNIAFLFAGKIMGIEFSSGSGSNWSNLFLPPFSSADNVTLGSVMGMMLLSCVIYTVLLWYLDVVWPWQPGVPKSPLFFLKKPYWMPSHDKDLAEFEFVEQQDSTYFEDEPVGLSPSIVISHLTKEFKMTAGVKLKAVNNLSLNMYSGQITVLLGHNGAGKTTTMNMLTGIFPPTRGTASIHGYDIVKSTNAARRSLGLCPQHNVLYDNLTVEEHLKFFAGLKGFSWSEMKAEITLLLDQLQLQDKRNTLSKDLSGGMKRKLSLGIAVVGGSKVLVLDEPSSGMDPEARRVIWDMLQLLRPERTILLTTHHMEEADALGDRIAIMASGTIQCCGSAIFLKRKFGAGYHLQIEKGHNCEVEQITNVIQRHVPDAKLVRNMSLELTYSLPPATAQFVPFFKDLEQQSQELGVASCSVAVTTMDDVFLKVGQMAEKNYEKTKQSQLPTDDDIREGVSLYSSEKPSSSLSQQMGALLMKRMNYAKRYLTALIFQAIIPFIAFSLFIYLDVVSKTSTYETFNFDLSEQFHDIKYGFIDLQTNTAKLYSFGRYYNETLERESVIVYDVDNPEEFLIQQGIDEVELYTRRYLVGGSISEEDNVLRLTAWYNGIHYHLSPMSLNLMTNALLQYKLMDSSSKISIKSHLLPEGGSGGLSAVEKEITKRIVNSLFLPLGLSFLSSSFVLFPIHERVMKAKLLQRMCGVSGIVFWLCHFVWDFFIHFLCCVLLLIPLLVYHGMHHFIASDAAGATFLCLLLYGLSSIPLSYLVSFIPSVPSSGFSILTILNCLTGVIALMVMQLLRFVISAKKFQTALSILRLFPIFAVSWGVNNVHIHGNTNIGCMSFSKNELEEQCNSPFFPLARLCCTEAVFRGKGFQKRQYLSWEDDAAGKECLYLTSTAMFWFILIVLFEILPMTFCKLTNAIKVKFQKRKTVESVNTEAFSISEDSDVSNERQRIEQLVYQNMTGEEALVVFNLTKCFGSLYAVKDLAFGVHKEECFGLLGVNGAGKTTTFRMLAGDLYPTRGNAFIGHSSIQKDINQFQTMTGYCPQFDALIDLLTGREILHLFANLRGIPKSEVTSNVNKMLEMCDLEKHADKTTNTYSGGTKRKLSLALSLIGAPPVILLDEPTAGVDPASRRKIWKTLATMRKILGVSFILTSHSMDECEILCNRVAIMVNGSFCCLGAMQSLRSKFGQGFSLVVKLSRLQSSFSKTDEVKSYIEDCFPSAILKVEHQGILNYHITDTSLVWSHMFSVMETGKQRYEFEDYMLGDTTLEQIFLAFAHAQKGL